MEIKIRFEGFWSPSAKWSKTEDEYWIWGFFCQRFFVKDCKRKWWFGDGDGVTIWWPHVRNVSSLTEFLMHSSPSWVQCAQCALHRNNGDYDNNVRIVGNMSGKGL